MGFSKHFWPGWRRCVCGRWFDAKGHCLVCGWRLCACGCWYDASKGPCSLCEENDFLKRIRAILGQNAEITNKKRRK